MKWLQEASLRSEDVKLTLLLKNKIKRIQKQAKAPKYPAFFDIDKITEFAFKREAKTKDEALKQLIIQVRMVTMMRSCDLANIHWTLLEHEEKFYIATTTKKGEKQEFSVTGKTLKDIPYPSCPDIVQVLLPTLPLPFCSAHCQTDLASHAALWY